MGLRFTSATDYAIRAMIHLACLPENGHALRDQIATSENIPSSFMAKILRSLVRAGLLNSARGVNGGFSLARDPEEVSLLDIVEAVVVYGEGAIQIRPARLQAEPPGRIRRQFHLPQRSIA